MQLRTLHRGLGLAAAIIWLVQAATGVAIAFRVEIDNMGVPGSSALADPAALAGRIAAVEADGGDVAALWAASYDATRFDLYYSNPEGQARLMRVDGQGRILRDGSSDALWVRGGIFRTFTKIHGSMMSGAAGQVILAIGAVLLITNLAAGLKLAWPMRGRWRQALLPRTTPHLRGRLHGWHRAGGLWTGAPLIVVVIFGLLLLGKGPLEDLLGVKRTPPVAPGSVDLANSSLAAAATLALAEIPGATLTALILPTEANPWLVVRLRAPDEVPRLFGMTTLYVDPRDGRIAKVLLASEANAARATVDALLPIHSGQAGGIVGRALVALCGLALLALCSLGVIQVLLGRKRRV